MSQLTRVVFTQGGKGGVAKTEACLSLIAWYQAQGISPALLDFDLENTNKSGLQNFYRLMSLCMPDWEKRKQTLRGYSAPID